MVVKIRKAKKGDLKRIAEIYKTEYAKKPYNEKWTDERVLKKMKEFFKMGHMYVAEADNKVIGLLISDLFLYYDGTNAYLYDFIVSSDYQGKGIGKMLFLEFEKELKRKKVKTIYLMAHKNAPALMFWKKRGFRENGYVSMKKRLK